MADAATIAWTPRGSWAGILASGEFGTAGQPGVTIEARDGLGIASLIAGDGRDEALAQALQGHIGLGLPLTPCIVSSARHSLVWAGPDQWHLIAPDRNGFDELLRDLAPLAAISDQSDGRAALRLSGPKVRDTLAKGCMLDLHPSAFPVGTAALTSIAYMGVHLWRIADDPASGDAVFEIMVARSMAGSFWSWLSASAAEFGCKVTATGRG
ncbi:Sarcosine oxidase, gamma subunit [Bosea sp. LC85]|uniref:sarcosine oxidase subunit gamma n=1 Tax=Bosea sp. LC85 TaxID=1502851 RepID=UPI0004E39D4D|nr:sarcosine oxidase subunit gamma family protein [Bosea sp. LC85]KFC75723.1 Sarcosine oxidase, gamma subunit [Bosea sp. LC85]